jgi:translation initiation factor 3 subunit J
VRKRTTLKQRLEQKEAEQAARIARGEFNEDELAEMHPQERARLERERELQSDLKHASDLFGDLAVGASKSSLLPTLHL